MTKKSLVLMALSSLLFLPACLTAENMARTAVIIKEDSEGQCLREAKVQSDAQQKACRDGVDFLADTYTSKATKTSMTEMILHPDRFVLEAKLEAKSQCMQRESAELQASCQIGIQVAWQEILQLSAASNSVSRSSSNN